jgi:hypothetical protein
MGKRGQLYFSLHPVTARLRKSAEAIPSPFCHCERSVAISVPDLLYRLYIAPVIGSGDVEYQAYPGVHHS